MLAMVLAESLQQSNGQPVTCETTRGDFTIDLHRWTREGGAQLAAHGDKLTRLGVWASALATRAVHRYSTGRPMGARDVPSRQLSA